MVFVIIVSESFFNSSHSDERVMVSHPAYLNIDKNQSNFHVGESGPPYYHADSGMQQDAPFVDNRNRGKTYYA